MSYVHQRVTIFDPVRVSSETNVDGYMLDTWHDLSLVTSGLVAKLPDLVLEDPVDLPLSGGMTFRARTVQIGLTIGGLRVSPIRAAVVDAGTHPLLLGTSAVKAILGAEAGSEGSSRVDYAEKYALRGVGIRLHSEEKAANALQLERFLRGIRVIHNVALFCEGHPQDSAEWVEHSSHVGVGRAVRDALFSDMGVPPNLRLGITWVEQGSIWLSFASGCASAFSWFVQIFQRSNDAKLRSLLSDVDAAREDTEVRQMTRLEIVRAKKTEQQRLSAENVRRTRQEWQRMVLDEIDFRKKLAREIKDPEQRAVLEIHLSKAITSLVASELMPVVEADLGVEVKERDVLPRLGHQPDGGSGGRRGD